MFKKIVRNKFFILFPGAFFLLLLFRLSFLFLPYKSLDSFLESPYSTVITDRNGVVLQVISTGEGERREYISIKEIPEISKNIFIFNEDKRFYYHFGVDPIALFRAVYLNVAHKTVLSGASTITMQLSRMINPQEKNIVGKLKEIFNAMRIEAKLNKNQILELYLNSIPFGFNAVGVETASKTFFGKKFVNLTPEELLVLSIVPRSPAKYNPLTSKEESVKLALRTKKNLNLDLKDSEIINSINSAKGYNYEYKAQHFVNFTKNEIRLKNEKTITTSLDIKLNEYVQTMMQKRIEGYKENRLTNGAVIVFDNYTGEILSYLGSKDFFDKIYGGEIDGVQVLNQPGSTLKPFLYALAIEKYNFLPSTVLPDVISNFGDEQVYIPKNFNNLYNGPVRLRVALASSLNVPAVHTVVRLGVRNFIETLIDLDFQSIANSKKGFGAGIAVGNAEVSLYELTRAFCVFVRDGKKITLTPLKQNKREFVEGKKIFSDYTSFIISDILSDQKSRTLGFGQTTIFDTPFQAIFKTGTSNQFNNLWALGANRDYTVGVWMGNFSGETVIGASGSSIPLLLCVEILKTLNRNKKIKRFAIPKGIKKELICSLSGKTVTPNCSGGIYEYFRENETLEKCNFHVFENSKVKILLPPIYSSFLKKIENSDFIYSDLKKGVEILYPNNNALYFFDPTINPEQQAAFFEIFSKFKKAPVDIFVNGDFYKTLVFPFNFYFPLKRGKYEISAISSGHKDEINIEVK